MSVQTTGPVAVFDPDYYSKVYEQIQDIIITCYVDYYILEFYKRQNDEIQRAQGQHPILHHVINLVKRDMCLNLWKICYDQDNAASTIKSLVTYCRDNGKQASYKKTPYWKCMQGQITEARNKYLAHSDVDRVTNSISVESMKHLLDESKDALNNLCLTECGIKILSDNSLSIMDLNTSMDVLSLLHQQETRED